MKNLNEYLMEDLFDDIEDDKIFHVGDFIIPKIKLTKISHDHIEITNTTSKEIVLGLKEFEILRKVLRDNFSDSVELVGKIDLEFKEDTDMKKLKFFKNKEDQLYIYIFGGVKKIKNLDINIPGGEISLCIYDNTKLTLESCIFNSKWLVMRDEKRIVFPKHKNCEFNAETLTIITDRAMLKYQHNSLPLVRWIEREDFTGKPNIKIFLIDQNVIDTGIGTIDFYFNNGSISFSSLLGDWHINRKVQYS